MLRVGPSGVTGKSPGRKPDVTDTEILDVFREADDPVLSTAEVAERLPIQQRGTYNRLDKLVNEGMLERKTIAKVAVYWIAEEK